MISPREVVPPFIVATLALNTIAVTLRLYVRLFITKALGLDDLALVLAFILLVLYCTTMWVAVAQGYAADDPEDIRNPVMAVKFFVVSSIFYILTLCFTKISSALVLYRLATTRRPIQRLPAVTGSIILTWGVTGTAVVEPQCRPLSIVWGETPKSEGICLPPYVMPGLGVSLAALEIVSAFLFATLPVSLLRRVQLPSSVKISVIILLGLGTLASIITVLRLKCLVDIAALKDAYNDKAESLYLRIHAYIVPEMGLALFTATIVVLPPLIKLIFQGGLESLGISETKGAPRTRASRKPDIALYEGSGWSDQFCAGSEENIIRDAGGTK